MLDRLLERYDPEVFSVGERTARVRIVGASEEPVDVVLSGDAGPRTEAASGRADAVLQADAATWAGLADDAAGGLDAFRRGRLRVRRDLHLASASWPPRAGAPACASPACRRARARCRRCRRERESRWCCCTASG